MNNKMGVENFLLENFVTLSLGLLTALAVCAFLLHAFNLTFLRYIG